MNIPRSTIKFIIKKLKEYGTTTNLLRGPPTKTHGPSKEGINQRGSKRPMITLKELQSSLAEIGVSVHRTTLSRTLHRAGLYRRVTRKKPLLLVFTKRHVGDSPNIWKKVLWSDETKM